jgi:hypothetical protein
MSVGFEATSTSSKIIHCINFHLIRVCRTRRSVSLYYSFNFCYLIYTLNTDIDIVFSLFYRWIHFLFFRRVGCIIHHLLPPLLHTPCKRINPAMPTPSTSKLYPFSSIFPSARVSVRLLRSTYPYIPIFWHAKNPRLSLILCAYALPHQDSEALERVKTVVGEENERIGTRANRNPLYRLQELHQRTSRLEQREATSERLRQMEVQASKLSRDGWG